MKFVQFTITAEELSSLYPLNRFSKESTFVARDERDILQCIAHYRERGLAFPPPREDALVLDGPRLDILLEYTLCSNHRLQIPVLDDVSFYVNPNAWTTFKNIARNYLSMDLNRGGLYKWDTGNTRYSQFYFLDKEIMESLRHHDLNPYEEQMQTWMRDDQRVRACAEKEGIIGRAPGQFRVYDGDQN
ncbi:hypothetical protein EXS74_03550 [Candidatus Woesearchaeota archaeon]|nr:hypothetical protein [Candidatus Woesearchaeota archaeon]